MKILNLYAGIGGNRKLWGDEVEVTAVEYDENIANIYKENYPNDNVIIGDAHQYLLDHFREYDFIWSSPPCPSHSRVRKQLAIKRKPGGGTYEQNKPIYPDMRLYQEILLLEGYFDGYWCIENVIPWYEPLIEPQKLGRHCFWTNFEIPPKKFEARGSFDNTNELAKTLGYDITNWKKVDKKLLLRNCTEPEIGKYILDTLYKEQDKPVQEEDLSIFDYL